MSLWTRVSAACCRQDRQQVSQQDRQQDRQQAALQRRLRKLARVFDLPALRRQQMDSAAVVQYYDHTHDAYRKYHSAEGAVHMALNDGGRFDPDGFYGQVRRIEQLWAQGGAPADVLELAVGQGFNLHYLAQRHPQVRFAGIDLTPVHLQIARDRLLAAGCANVTLEPGDYHALQYADASFDAVFCIEAFCHAMDMDQAFAQVARVLRPGGRFILFDGYLPTAPRQLPAEQALAVELVAKGMAIDQLQVLDDVLASAGRAGFAIETVQALDAQVMPSLRKLQRLTGAVIRMPWLARRALARRSAARGRNVLAGYLMHSAVAMGLIGYRQLVLRKQA